MNVSLTSALKHWPHFEPIISPPDDDATYGRLLSYLDQLLDIVGEDESHPLSVLINIIADNIEAYDEKYFTPKHTTGVDALKFLMQQHELRQTDLNGIASQGVMSEILNGKRKLNVRQIQALAKRFKVSPEVFMDDE